MFDRLVDLPLLQNNGAKRYSGRDMARQTFNHGIEFIDGPICLTLEQVDTGPATAHIRIVWINRDSPIEVGQRGIKLLGRRMDSAAQSVKPLVVILDRDSLVQIDKRFRGLPLGQPRKSARTKRIGRLR